MSDNADPSIDRWLESAVRDAESRGLPELKSLLPGLGQATRALRDALRSSQPALRSTGIGRPPDPVVTPSRPFRSASPLDARVSTIAAFGQSLRTGRVSAVEMVDECLSRIAADAGRLNAFTLVMADEARRTAREMDAELARGHDRGPLHGVPVSIKDLFDVRGTPTTAASRVRAEHVADRDAPAIAQLRAAGAVLIGKTNLHEFAFGTTNEDSSFGPARHPLDPSRSPGGSSGGSAVSVAAGMALATLGTDTGGSVRIPAAACGIVGLKPTYGELSAEGLVPLARTLDHVGPLSVSVTDAWLMYRGLHGARERIDFDADALKALRIGVLRSYFCDLLDDDVRASFEGSLAAIRAAGASVGDAEVPHSAVIAPVYLHIVLGEAAAYHGEMLQAAGARYTPPVRLRLEMARYVLAEDYVRALALRDQLKEEVDRALEGCDALVLPTLPIPAPYIGESTVQVGTAQEPVRNVMLRLTQLFNLTGHPAITIPCGAARNGLPCGFQIVGRRGATETLLQAALSLENAIHPERTV